MCIVPKELPFQTGGEYHLQVWNNGSAQHNLTFGWEERITLEGLTGRRVLNAGETAWMNFTVTSTLGAIFWCDVPGHRDLGMWGVAIVNGNRPGGFEGPPELPISQYTILATIAAGAAVLFVYHVVAVRRERGEPSPQEKGRSP
jgi:hypothetical protein